MMSNMDAPETAPLSAEAALAWQNECEGWLALGRLQAGSHIFSIEEYPGLTCAWWRGSPLQMDNYFQAHPSGWKDPAALLAQVEKTYHAAGTAASQTVLRHVDIPTQRPWKEAAQAHGFRLGDASPVMRAYLDTPPELPPLAENVKVVKVQEPAQYYLALEIINEVFGGPRTLSEFFNPLGGVHIFLAYYAGQPAASATLWPYAGTAGIYSVATRPRYRRRGLALAVVGEALAYARQKGFERACLRTSPNLFPLYRRLGFQAVGQVLRYVKP